MVTPELLRRYPFFAGLTHQQLTSLATVAHTMSFEAGETVFRDGEPTRVWPHQEVEASAA